MELCFPAGFQFVDPLTSLLYALKLPERQTKYPLGILFYDTEGELCYLCLFVDGDGRYLNVYRNSPGGRWLDYVRFLAVREVQPLVA